jgi:hypothetical protein
VLERAPPMARWQAMLMGECWNHLHVMVTAA